MTDRHTQRLLAADRSQSWWLLSRCYLERPDTAFLRDLAADLAAVPQGTELDREVQALRTCLGSREPEELHRRLAPEYTRLFRGIQEGMGPPPPYESLHRGGGLMSDTTQEVRAHYLAAGFGEIVPEAGPQDHLGAELRFLSLLGYREAEAWEKADEEQALGLQEAQRSFLEQHLLAWLPDYARRIADESKEPFYLAVAELTRRFAQQVQVDLDLAQDAIQVV